ncbi:MAG: polyphosphate kinase 2 family protein [Betaproteobacteria bacterium]|nr:polyphosphate kinase 2 family protein [Betaproteobacteria bacterium]
METKTLKRLTRLIAPYRIDDGKKFKLKHVDPGDTGGLGSEYKDEASEWLQQTIGWLAEEQEKLFAQDKWAVLLIFQAMDAAGKDSTIKHVMSGINPQGCEVTSFKVPTSNEIDHDFLWRTNRRLPERGRIGIFNRSYYEEVLVVRVHPDILVRQKLPRGLITKKIWKERYEDISAYERYLTRNGVAIRKFFLHVSQEEQRRRFLERIDDQEKNWKFSAQDVREREHWDDYMRAFEDAIRATATPHAPWFVVPADNKWFTRIVVAGAIVELMEGLGLRYPVLADEQRAELLTMRQRLVPRKRNRS